MKSRKVFIYTGQGISLPSANDLYTLFTMSENIFPDIHPDVRIGDFNFNLTGLQDPVFVVPGGSTGTIGRKLKPQIENVKMHFGEDFGYVGICAGAYLGAADADLFHTSHNLKQMHQVGSTFLVEDYFQNEDNLEVKSSFERAVLKQNSLSFFPSLYCGSTKDLGLSLDLIKNYRAFGALYPDQSYISPAMLAKDYMPYRVSLSLASSPELSQLYVGGPAFEATQEESKGFSSEVVAFYKGYSKPVPAIIRQSSAKEQGGKLLSGTHFESCVEDSQLLAYFDKTSNQNEALTTKDSAALKEEREQAQTEVESMLRDTLKVKK